MTDDEDASRKYSRWAATTGLALEREVAGWIAKCQRIERERDELKTERDGLEALSVRQGWLLGAQDISLQTQQHVIEQLRGILEQIALCVPPELRSNADG